ncbi:MAG: 3,4-dehydroadipyl-CoA semialdehyde dehydrogenase [Planctomycetes bacterium]|nr:3,4-dehydroadipyl-CoA semialdehyde dehydrogenase [Planctomycetota bacterium]
MRKLGNYVADRWVEGDGVQSTLVNPATGAELAQVSTAGLDFGAMARHAREVGGPALRSLSFRERAGLLKAMSAAIHDHREELIDLGVANCGNTRGDAKFDIDGATGTLAAYAAMGKELGESRFRLDGDAVDMGQSSRMQGRHIMAPRRGVAYLINAYNFPAWGFAEKAACALLAGMPVINKPGTITALMAHRIQEILVEREVLPAGTVSLVCGRAGDMLDHVEWQDCVAFTGSAATGQIIRSHPKILELGVRVNVEADSLNCAILGPDVDDESETFDLFIQHVVGDLTQKSGQKCTAIRRVIVPEGMREAIKERVGAELARIPQGDPGGELKVRMGPLSGPKEREDARSKLALLLAETRPAVGDPADQQLVSGDFETGAYMRPLMLEADSAEAAPSVHAVEVFGPVSTMVPYDGRPEEAARIAGLGRGSLVASFYSDDRDFAAALIEEIAPYQGRLVWGSKKVAGTAPGPGTVFPQFIHGGPGRAGGGEELGGLRGLDFFSQRLAVQGYGPLLDRLLT